MTPDQKKTLLEMSMLMRKNKEKELETRIKQKADARNRREMFIEELAPLDPEQANDFLRRRDEYFATLPPLRRERMWRIVGKDSSDCEYATSLWMDMKFDSFKNDKNLTKEQRRGLRNLAEDLVEAQKESGKGDFESFVRYVAENDKDTYEKLRPYFRAAYVGATGEDLSNVQAERVYRLVDSELEQKIIDELNRSKKVNILAAEAIARIDVPGFISEADELDIVNLLNALMAQKGLENYSDEVIMEASLLSSWEMSVSEMACLCNNLEKNAEKVVYNLETEGVTSETLYPLSMARP